MKPEIFMDRFERTDYDDALFAAVGRALTFATHFEANCKGVSTFLQLRGNAADILASEKSLAAFSKRIESLKLYQHIKLVTSGKPELAEILDRARKARNEVAHELTLGLDEPPADEGEIESRTERLKEIGLALAEADRLVCILLSVLTNEPLPVPKFIRDYPAVVTEWICRFES